jgi:hypothetical protein
MTALSFSPDFTHIVKGMLHNARAARIGPGSTGGIRRMQGRFVPNGGAICVRNPKSVYGTLNFSAPDWRDEKGGLRP